MKKRLFVVLMVFIVGFLGGCANHQNSAKKAPKTKSYPPIKRLKMTAITKKKQNQIKHFLVSDYLKDDLPLTGIFKNSYKIQVARVDLNNDGIDETFIRFFAPYFCGTGGCNFLLLDNNQKIITTFTVTRAPIYVEKRQKNGWSVLVVWTRDGYRELTYRNGKYNTNPSMAKKSRKPSQEDIILFNNDTDNRLCLAGSGLKCNTAHLTF